MTAGKEQDPVVPVGRDHGRCVADHRSAGDAREAWRAAHRRPLCQGGVDLGDDVHAAEVGVLDLEHQGLGAGGRERVVTGGPGECDGRPQHVAPPRQRTTAGVAGLERTRLLLPQDEVGRVRVAVGVDFVAPRAGVTFGSGSARRPAARSARW
ncbi:MAG: hypothetical protein ABMB14_41075, partial [Myxococcota bacterium]